MQNSNLVYGKRRAANDHCKCEMPSPQMMCTEDHIVGRAHNHKIAKRHRISKRHNFFSSTFLNQRLIVLDAKKAEFSENEGFVALRCFAL